jgi:hypothetical protein
VSFTGDPSAGTIGQWATTPIEETPVSESEYAPADELEGTVIARASLPDPDAPDTRGPFSEETHTVVTECTIECDACGSPFPASQLAPVAEGPEGALWCSSCRSLSDAPDAVAVDGEITHVLVSAPLGDTYLVTSVLCQPERTAKTLRRAIKALDRSGLVVDWTQLHVNVVSLSPAQAGELIRDHPEVGTSAVTGP